MGSERLIPIDWRRIQACATPGRRFKVRTDGAVKSVCPDGAEIWRARVTAPLDKRDWLAVISSSLADFPWDMLIEAVDCIRLQLFPDALYIVKDNSGIMLADITRKGARLSTITGPDQAGEYHDVSRTLAKVYRVQ